MKTGLRWLLIGLVGLAGGCSATPEPRNLLEIYRTPVAGVTGAPGARAERYRASELRYEGAVPVRTGPETIRVFEYPAVDPSDDGIWRDGRWVVIETRPSEWVGRWEGP